MIFHLSLIFYAHHTCMRSQMLCTNRSFEICEERMLVKQRQRWLKHVLAAEKIFMLKQKSSNLYMICFNSVKKFLSNYLLHSALACAHKCFTQIGHLKSAKSECLWSSVEHRSEALNCCWKKYLYLSNPWLKHLLSKKNIYNIYAQAKIIKSDNRFLTTGAWCVNITQLNFHASFF